MRKVKVPVAIKDPVSVLELEQAIIGYLQTKITVINGADVKLCTALEIDSVSVVPYNDELYPSHCTALVLYIVDLDEEQVAPEIKHGTRIEEPPRKPTRKSRAKGGKPGRPVNPNSKRQARLKRRAVRETL